MFYLYKQAFQFGQMGYAAALSVVLFVVSLLLAGGRLPLGARLGVLRGEEA